MYGPPSGRGPSLRRRFFMWLSITRSKASNAPPNSRVPSCSRVNATPGSATSDDQEVVLGPRQRDGGVVPPDLPGRAVDVEVEEADGFVSPLGGRRVGGTRSPEHGTDTRHELARLERLRHVVVGADLEAGDAVDQVVARGQHHHRRGAARGPELAQDLEPGSTWKHHVEDDQVRCQRQRSSQGTLAVGLGRDVVALAGEVRADDLEDVRLVVDDEDAGHGRQHRRRPDVIVRPSLSMSVRFDVYGRPGPCGPVPSQVPVPADVRLGPAAPPARIP